MRPITSIDLYAIGCGAHFELVTGVNVKQEDYFTLRLVEEGGGRLCSIYLTPEQLGQLRGTIAAATAEAVTP